MNKCVAEWMDCYTHDKASIFMSSTDMRINSLSLLSLMIVLLNLFFIPESSANSFIKPIFVSSSLRPFLPLHLKAPIIQKGRGF